MIPEYCALLNMPAVRYREELPNKRSVWVCLNKTCDSNRQGQRALMRASRYSGLRGAPAGKGPNRAADPAPRADADASRYAREEGRSCHHQTPPMVMAGCAYMLPATRVTHPRELHAERSPPADDVIAPAGPRPLAAEWRNVFIWPSSSNWASVMVSCSTRIRMAPTARDVQLHLFEKK